MMGFLEGFTITPMMITSMAITVILSVVAIISSSKLEMVPSTKLQLTMEIIIEKLRDFFSDVMGEYAGRKYLPIVATLFIYILLSNYSGLLPLSGHLPFLAAPTSSINFPAGLAIVVFFAVQIIGIRETHGIPIMLVEEFVRPLSLTLRLYGNIFGEEKVTESFFHLVPLGIPVIMQLLSILMGAIQALVFALLAGIYISEAAEHGAEEHEKLEAHA